MHDEDGEGSDLTNFSSEGNKTGLSHFRTVTVYSLAIEPLLCRLWSQLNGVSLVFLVYSRLSLFLHVQMTRLFLSHATGMFRFWKTYKRASSARANWAKSAGTTVAEANQRPVCLVGFSSVGVG